MRPPRVKEGDPRKALLPARSVVSCPSCVQQFGRQEKGGRPRRNRATSSRQPAGVSPVRGDARVPGSTAPGVGRDPGVEAERQRLVVEAVQPTGPQHEAKPAASSLKPPRERGQGGAEPMKGGRRPRTAPENLERVPTNPPAHGAWNGRKGVVGTGEALLGPGSAAREAGPPITNAREVAGGREGVGGGRSSDDGRDNTTRPPAKGPCFTGAPRERGGDLVSAR